MQFWPTELKTFDSSTPRQILLEVGEQLVSEVDYAKVEVESSKLEDRTVLSFKVTNLKSNVCLNLFDVYLALNINYPCAISPPKLELPSFLERQRIIPARKNPIREAIEFSIAGLEETPVSTVENKWICASAQELRKKLRDLLHEDVIVGQINNLLSNAAV